MSLGVTSGEAVHDPLNPDLWNWFKALEFAKAKRTATEYIYGTNQHQL